MQKQLSDSNLEVQMSDDILAPWRASLARALHRNRSLAYSRYLQLATVNLKGHPANRTVVFRGFVDEPGTPNQLKFISDRRSRKIHHITHNPWAEACWYFPKTREQFRLSGPLNIVESKSGLPEESDLYDKTWQSLSKNARSQFYWPQPGAPRQETDEFASIEINDEVPPETFCLILLAPIQVDHLELRGQPQNRFLYRQDESQNWRTQPITP